MKIYVDVLIITNSLICLIYLRCISHIVRQNIPAKREAAAAAAAGVGSLIAVADAQSMLSAFLVILAEMLIISAVIITAFLPHDIREFVKYFFLYLVTELLFGGCCFMIINLTKARIVCIKNYVIYFDVSLMQLGICSALIYIITALYESFQRRKLYAEVRYKARCVIGKYEITLPALADTGNHLSDSFTGEPVVIFRSDDMYEQYKLDMPEQMAFYGFRAVPYSTIGGDGLVFVTSKGNVTIFSDESSKEVKCCVGIVPSEKRKQCAIFNPCIL